MRKNFWWIAGGVPLQIEVLWGVCVYVAGYVKRGMYVLGVIGLHTE